MSIWFALFALVVLAVIFGVTYKIKGLGAALLAAGIVLVGLAALYFGMVFLIVSSME